MKKQLMLLGTLCAGILLFLNSACKKDEQPAVQASPQPTPTTQYFMRFKIDGVEKSYGGNGNSCSFNMPDTANGYFASMVLGRSNPTVVNLNQLTIIINDVPQLSPGIIYTSYSTTQPNTVALTHLFNINYHDENGQETFCMAESIFAPIGLNSNACIELTELTPTYARGTFSCSLYDTTFTTAVHSLTEGEFFLPRY